MAGKPNGKVFKTMVEKHGSEEAARAWFREIGSRGGRNGTTGGFGANIFHFCNELAGEHKTSQCAGAKGGRVSKRRKKEV